MNTLYLVMPAYNEESNIESVVKSWYRILEKASDESRFIVADSGSKDNTHDILIKLKTELPKIEVLSDTRKEHGSKLIAMYKYAIKKNADYVFQTDSDGQTNPDEFYAFWDMRKDYDVILGNRVIRGDGAFRKFVENVVCFLLKMIFGVSVKDANVPYRLMKAEVLNKYIDRFVDDYNIPNIMLTAFFKFYNEKIYFKEITFKSRKAGKNSINILKIVKIGLGAIKDFYRFKKDMT